MRVRSVFARLLALSLLFAGLIFSRTGAHAQEPEREVFLPAAGKGAIVVVVSGASGMKPYRDFSAKLAEIGYYTVLMKGSDLFDMFNPTSEQGASNLTKVLTEAQSAPYALPGKAALVGLSLGGAGVLLHGAPMQEQVSAVVAYYPAINRLGVDETVLAARLHAPTLVLAAEKDEQNNCCKIESMRALAAAPKTAPFELVVYPDAGHAFNLHLPQFAYRDDDARDAWVRTSAFLTRLHPPRGR